MLSRNGVTHSLLHTRSLSSCNPPKSAAGIGDTKSQEGRTTDAPPSGIDFPFQKGAPISWNGSCLYYFRRPRVGSGTGEAEKSLVLGCIRGNSVLLCLSILLGVLVLRWVFQDSHQIPGEENQKALYSGR